MDNNENKHNVIYTNISGYSYIHKHSSYLYCKLIKYVLSLVNNF